MLPRTGETNTTLFRSGHLAVVVVVVALHVATLVALDARPGNGEGSHRAFLLTSGWVALILYVVVVAYVLRKYVHRTRYSRLRRPLPIAKLEAAETRLNGLRGEVRAGRLVRPDEIRERAQRIFREEGVDKVMRLELMGAGEGQPPELRVVPTEPMGRVAVWLHAHLYYGLGGFALFGLHGGNGFGSPMGILLSIGTILVMLSGIWGIALWSRGPLKLTRKEDELGIPIEMAHALHQSLRATVSRCIDALSDAARARVSATARGADFDARAEATLAWIAENEPDQLELARDALTAVGQEREVGARLAQLRAVRRGFMSWRMVHVPVAWFLVGVVAIHALSIWVY